MPVPQSFSDARVALRSSRDVTANKLFARTTAQQSLDAALRLGDPSTITAAQNALQTASSDLVTARANEATARTTLNNLIASWLTVSGSSPPQPLTPDADLARLDLAGAPIALFPVRLETRFDVTAKVLHIRVYPDEFFSDIHEREMTPDESAAAADYWAAVSNDGQESADLWAPVAKRFGVPRAAYIIEATDPSK